MTLLFCLSPLGKEHKMLLLFTLGKEQFNEKLGKGRKFTFSWINFQMTQPIWRVHILYISASLKKKKKILMFFSLRLKSPLFLSILFSLLITMLQVNAYHKQMQCELLQMERSWSFLLRTLYSRLSTSWSELGENSCEYHMVPASLAPLSHKVC